MLNIDKLTNAIVLQAVEDWRMLCRAKKKRMVDVSFNELTNFFKSDWCRDLSSVDPDLILIKLRAERKKAFVERSIDG